MFYDERDGTHPAEIANRRPALATRHFHRPTTYDPNLSDQENEQLRRKHDPERGDKEDDRADYFYECLRSGHDPLIDKAKGERE